MTEAVIKTIAPNSKMGNEVKVQETPTGQFIMTVPRSIADAWGLKKGDTVEFLFEEGRIFLQKKKLVSRTRRTLSTGEEDTHYTEEEDGPAIEAKKNK